MPLLPILSRAHNSAFATAQFGRRSEIKSSTILHQYPLFQHILALSQCLLQGAQVAVMVASPSRPHSPRAQTAHQRKLPSTSSPVATALPTLQQTRAALFLADRINSDMTMTTQTRMDVRLCMRRYRVLIHSLVWQSPPTAKQLRKKGRS